MFIHNIDPILLSIGPFQIRYYGLFFVLGFIIAYFLLVHLAKRKELDMTKDDVADFLLYIIVGVVLGARIFYVLVYNLPYYLSNPFDILAVWNGGLSFEPYTPEFNRILKEKIRKRDNHTCQKCNEKQDGLYFNAKRGKVLYKLNVHHIDYDKNNCDYDNLIALCFPCNSKVNFNRQYWTNYFQNLITIKTLFTLT